MKTTLLLLLGRWGHGDARRICRECSPRPTFCELLEGDVTGLCAWLGTDPAEVSHCAKLLEGDYVLLDVWFLGDEERVERPFCQLPFWWVFETIGFLDLQVIGARAPSRLDVYATTTPLGQLVFVRGCASNTRELYWWQSRASKSARMAGSITYMVYGDACSVDD